MSACKVTPYLPKDGTIYNFAQYTALGQQLGSTFGGNGVTTFGVPDERNRMRLAWDNTGTANRVTSAGSGISGITMGAAGGDQLLQSHNHPLTDPTHTHPVTQNAAGASVQSRAGGSPVAASFGSATITIQNASTGITIATTGGGGSQNMPPTIVSFLALIKT